MDILSLPYDVWFALSLFLTIRDLCVFQSTCKTLRDALDTHQVWSAVLNDILRVVPFQYPDEVCGLPSEDMRALCVRAFRIYRAWTGKNFAPPLILEAHGALLRGTTLLPGGKHLLALDDNGFVFSLLTIDGQESQTIPVTAMPTGDPGDDQDLMQIQSTNVVELSMCTAYVIHSQGSGRVLHFTIYLYDGSTMRFIRVFTQRHLPNDRFGSFHVDGSTLWLSRMEQIEGNRYRLWNQPIVGDELGGPERLVAVVSPGGLGEPLTSPVFISPTMLYMFHTYHEPHRDQRFLFFRLPEQAPEPAAITSRKSFPVVNSPAAFVKRPFHGVHWIKTGLPFVYRTRRGDQGILCAAWTIEAWGPDDALLEASFGMTVDEGDLVKDTTAYAVVLKFIDMYGEVWGTPYQADLETNPILGKGFMGRFLCARPTFQPATPGDSRLRRCALLCHRLFEPRFHADLVEGYAGYLRLGQAMNGPAVLPGGIMNVQLPANEEPLIFNVDEMSGRIAIVSSVVDEQDGSGHPQHNVIRVYDSSLATHSMLH